MGRSVPVVSGKMKELVDEGIGVVPLVDVSKLEN